MIKAVLKRRAAPGGHKPPKKAPHEPEPVSLVRPEPTRARSSRASAAAANEAARCANKRDAEPSADETSASEEEAEEAAPPPPRKKQKAAPPKGQRKRTQPAAKKPPAKKQGAGGKGKARLPVPDSSDEEDISEDDVPLGQRVAQRVADSSDADEV